jgi:hypothetical protein
MFDILREAASVGRINRRFEFRSCGRFSATSRYGIRERDIGVTGHGNCRYEKQP